MSQHHLRARTRPLSISLTSSPAAGESSPTLRVAIPICLKTGFANGRNSTSYGTRLNTSDGKTLTPIPASTMAIIA